MTILHFLIQYVQKIISKKMKLTNSTWMVKQVDIRQDRIEKIGQYGDRTRDIRVISTTL